MQQSRNFEPIDLILELVYERSYILDENKYDEIKNTMAYQLYSGIEDDLAEDKNFDEISLDDIQVKALETIQNLKHEVPQILSLLTKHINNISSEDIVKYYDMVLEHELIYKKVKEYETELINKNKGKFYTVNEAIKILGYSHKASIYHHINNNHLVVNKLSERKTIIYEKDLDAFIKKTYKMSLLEYMRLSQEEKKALHKN